MGGDTSRYPDFVFVACDYDMGAQTYDLAVSMEAGSLVGSPVKYVRHDITRPTAEHGELETVGTQWRYRAIGKTVGEWSEWQESPVPHLMTSAYEIETRELVTRSQADAIIAAERAENKLLKAGIKRLSDEEELLSETTDGDMISVVKLAGLLAETEADNAALTARVDVQDQEISDQSNMISDQLKMIEALEAKLAAAEKALEQVSTAPLSGWTIAQGIARAALEGKP